MALAQDMLAGAQLVNMGWQRQERMQELRAQQAMRQMQERHLAAQAQYLTEQANQIQFKMQQEQEDDATLMATQQLYQNRIRLGEDPAKVQAELDASLMYANPRAFEKISRAREYQAQQKKAEAAVKRMNAGSLDAQAIRDENGNVISYAVDTGTGQTHFISPDKQSKLPEKQQMAQRYADLRRQEATLTEALDKVGFGSPLQKQEVESNLARVRDEMSVYAKELGDKSFKIVTIKGKDYIQTANGAVKPVEKNLTKREFIDRHLNEFKKDAATTQDAIKELESVWEQLKQKEDSESSPAPPKAPAKTYNPVTRRLE